MGKGRQSHGQIRGNINDDQGARISGKLGIAVKTGNISVFETDFPWLIYALIYTENGANCHFINIKYQCENIEFCENGCNSGSG